MEKFRQFFELTESEAKVVIQVVIAIILITVIGYLTGHIYIP